ncbi:MAG: hypothetical protein IJ715_03680 [Bacilli bacterium]|nr:hypothetical protein [Bacilli bacterium]
MNVYNVSNPEFKESIFYKEFLDNNPTVGYLKIRAYAASEALPISNLQVEISKTMGDNKIIFFSGVTDNSGMIERVTLPTPKLSINDLNVPNNIEYDIKTTYEGVDTIYKVIMFEGVCVVQTININPNVGES